MTERIVSLTFDNGPTPGITEAILDVLAGRNVPATFFAIGRKLVEHPQLGRLVLSNGHRLGGHTFMHGTQFGALSDDSIARELTQMRDAVQAVGGEDLLFRPYGAGGVIDDRLMGRFGADTLCADGYTCVLWNVLPGDWRDQDGWVDAAIAGVEQHDWSVVVLHDIASGALDRLDEFIDRVGPVTWSQDFPESCTPVREGAPTSSFDVLLPPT
jgi:peptidoglycan/xylan/chitin deacetylase (PgdA/CDA1 family)